MNNSQEAYKSAVLAMQKLVNKAKQSKSTSLRSSIVALFTADDENPLRFSGKVGMLQLDFDRQHKLHFLRLYDIESLEILLQVQLYYGFGQNYHKVHKQTLYAFDMFSDGIIAFEFRNKQQAQLMAIKIKSVSPKNEDFRQLMKDRVQKQIEQRKSNSFFGKLKKKFNSIGKQPEQVQQQSIVLNVEKKKSIKMNFETGQFDCDNAPPEWEQLLQKVGMKKQDMKDKQQLKIVFQQILLHEAKKKAQEDPHLIDKKHLDMIKQQVGQQTSSSSNFIPPPPNINLPLPPNISLPPPPPLTIKTSSGGQGGRVSTSMNSRVDLMAEIRNNNLKLKPVKASQKGVELDLSSMNKEQRQDLAEHIRLKLQRRKQALNRRKASDSEDDD